MKVKDLYSRPIFCISDSSKIPRNPKDLSYAKANDPATFGTYEECRKYLDQGYFLGLLICMDLVLIDLDDCISEDGQISDFAADFLAECPSYAEVSQSGRGIHILGLSRDKITIKTKGLEVYSQDRFVILTQNHVLGEEFLPDTILPIDLKKIEVVKPFLEKTNARSGFDFEIKPFKHNTLGEPIEEGSRNNALFSYASKLQDQGLTKAEILVLLEARFTRDVVDKSNFNFTELVQIANSASRYESRDVSASPAKKKIQQLPTLTIEDIKNCTAPEPIRMLILELLDSSPLPLAPAALCATFSFLASCYGQKIKSESDLRCNLYTLIVAPPGTGKDAPRKILKKIAHLCDQPHLFSVDDITSDTALFGLLEKNKTLCLTLDEMGILLENADANAVSRTIIRSLLTLYSQSDEIIHTKVYASGDQKILEYPHLSIFGSCTPSQYKKACKSRALGDGLISRMIILHADRRQSEPRIPASFDYGKWCEFSKKILHFQGDEWPGFKILDIEGEDLRKLDLDLHHRIMDSSTPDSVKDILCRVPLIARKLLLLMGNSCQDHGARSWIFSLTDLLIRQAFYFASVTEQNDYSLYTEEILTLLSSEEEKRIADLIAATPHIPRRIRKEILDDLIDTGQVQHIKRRYGSDIFMLNPLIGA